MDHRTIGYSIERHKTLTWLNMNYNNVSKIKSQQDRKRGRGKAKQFLLFSLLCCFMISFNSVVRASGVFELELIKLESSNSNSNVNALSSTNHSDDTTKTTTTTTENLQPVGEQKLRRVFVCLKEAFTRSQLVDGPCTFGNASIFVSQQEISNQTLTGEQQQQNLQGSLLTNLVRIPITFKWTKSFTIILSVEEPELVVRASSVAPSPEQSGLADNQLPHQHLRLNNGTNDSASSAIVSQENVTSTTIIVDRHVLTENEVIPDLEINPNKPWTSRFSRRLKSSLAYRFRLYCALNYYGDGCNTFCRSRDDQFGHYKCSSSGQKVCLEGWHGQENNCLQAKCLIGCQTGQCDQPNTCKCRSGWTGPLCDQCVTYPGCQQGYCLSPGQCLCRANWGGLLCDQDLNYCSSHEPCKNNATCQNVGPGRYKCNNCPDGFTGVNCDLSFNSNQHQQQPHQLTAGCALNPCLNGGVCYGFETTADKLLLRTNRTTPGRYYRCQCTSGWTGDYCQWPESQLAPSRTDYYTGDADDKNSTTEYQDHESSETVTSVTGIVGADLDSHNPDSQLGTETSRVRFQTVFIENPSLATATVATTATTTTTLLTSTALDMRHIISGVVVASAIGVCMASLLLAWCCLAAFERNGFSFIQMNIIRAASASSSTSDSDAASAASDQSAPVKATLRRMQEKIRNSFRCSSFSKRQTIKPQTKLSIENVLRPPPSYEESKYQSHPDYVGVVVVEKKRSLNDTGQPYAAGLKTTDRRVTLQMDEEPAAKSNLVIRGAIEQKLLQASNKSKQQAATKAANLKSSNPVSEQQTTTTTTTKHISTAQLSCPKHGHLYRNKQQPPCHQQHYSHQSIRPNLTERDLKVSYPNEIVIRADDLYEDHSALR